MRYNKNQEVRDGFFGEMPGVIQSNGGRGNPLSLLGDNKYTIE